MITQNRRQEALRTLSILVELPERPRIVVVDDDSTDGTVEAVRTQFDRDGFYGFEVHSLWESLYGIMAYLQRHDGSALPGAWRAFRCFEPYGEDVQEYARATRFVPESCEDEVVALLHATRGHARITAEGDPEAPFAAEQDALMLKNAEAYYRTMVRGGADSWNLRDSHMVETLGRLMDHHGPDARAIVWEHNTHIGDARYTDMADEGEHNVGQLVRQRYGETGQVVLVGFGSHRGSVIAGRRWDAPMERMAVPPARGGSWEDVLHQAGPEDKLLLFPAARRPRGMLESRGHRAIGVVYRPELESYGHYVPSVLPSRYDAFLYLDMAEALHPLHEVQLCEAHEVPETFPSGV